MPGARKKIKRFVIDVNALVSIFMSGQMDWFTVYIAKNRIEIFIDKALLAELTAVLDYSKIKKSLKFSKDTYVDFVRFISTEISTSAHNISCPDPDDDYLFDLALSAHAKIIVTGEKALLNWKHSPVELVSLADFKKLF